ncbi:MAG TPA: ATP-binding protein [Phycisphaerae bacterium]|nr:ATP-binding protein [Phycisphaerae bacterium]
MSVSPSATSESLTASEGAVQDPLTAMEQRIGELTEQLRQAQKLAAMGTMSAMLLHELNNLLTPLVSYAQYASTKDDRELMRKALLKAVEQAEKVSGMSDRILNMATNQDPGVAPTGLKVVADEAVACVGRDLAKDNITLAVNIDPELKVLANAHQLQQVVYNLILNARQAMLGKGGRLSISAQDEGRNVRLSVADTGIGIKPEYLGRIFEPFFTTKRSADRADRRGIGLGLAVCKDIIEEHGGTIEVASAASAGATFVITLPAEH